MNKLIIYRILPGRLTSGEVSSILALLEGSATGNGYTICTDQRTEAGGITAITIEVPDDLCFSQVFALGELAGELIASRANVSDLKPAGR